MTKEITKRKLLLVEGADEVSFIGALLQMMDSDEIQLWDAKGKDQMPKALSAVRLAPGFESVTSLGVIRDADNDAAAAFESVKTSLQKNSYPVPSAVGMHATGSGLTTSVFVLPGGEQPGMLETLAWNSVALEQLAIEVDVFLDRCATLLPADAPGEQLSSGPTGWRKPRNRDKARMLAFLSTMIQPLSRMGIAAERGYFDLSHVAFASLREYLTAL